MTVPKKVKKVSKHAEDALDEFEDAAVDLGFIGSMHPDDHEQVRTRYKKAKERILRHLAK